MEDNEVCSELFVMDSRGAGVGRSLALTAAVASFFRNAGISKLIWVALNWSLAVVLPFRPPAPSTLATVGDCNRAPAVHLAITDRLVSLSSSVLSFRGRDPCEQEQRD